MTADEEPVCSLRTVLTVKNAVTRSLLYLALGLLLLFLLLVFYTRRAILLVYMGTNSDAMRHHAKFILLLARRKTTIWRGPRDRNRSDGRAYTMAGILRRQILPCETLIPQACHTHWTHTETASTGQGSAY
jgi:hypothetical protein